MQRSAVDAKRCDDGNFGAGEFRRELVFFFYRIVAPAAWPVELGNNGCAALNAYLVDAVFVAVKRKHATVALKTEALERVENIVGLQFLEGE